MKTQWEREKGKFQLVDDYKRMFLPAVIGLISFIALDWIIHLIFA